MTRRAIPGALCIALAACGTGDRTGGDGPGYESAEEDGMVVTRGIDYRPDADHAEGRDLLDVYMPPGASRVPVVVWFHGGALQIGTKADAEPVAEALVRRGIGVVAPNYRLTPEVMHPDHVRDAAAAFTWAIDHVAELGGDPRRVYVGGHSAGGYLAALLLLDPERLRATGISVGAAAGGVLLAPFLYVEETARDRPKTVWGEDPGAWLAASVTPHVGAGKAPMLIVYADGDDDWRKAQIQRFASEMGEAGNDVRAVEVPDRDHITLASAMTAEDDRAGALIADFVLRAR